MSALLGNVEIRNLKEGTLYNVIQILDTNDDWKRFMSHIPKDLQNARFVPKYNIEHIRLIEEHSKTTNEKCTKILFDEWGTSGQVRPTLRTIMEIAKKVEMIRVIEEVARLLGEAPPPRPREGPAASINTNISLILQESELHRQPTALVKSEKSASDFIKFSTNTVSQNSSSMNHENRGQSNYDIQGYSGQSESNMPAWSKLVVSPHPLNHSVSVTTSTVNSDTQMKSEGVQDTENSSHTDCTYQKSLPNIDAFRSDTDNTHLTLSSQIDKSILQDTNLRHFKYEELQAITNNFLDTIVNGLYGPIGKIGQGGFGEVFVGYHSEMGNLAIKKTHEYIIKKPEVAVKVFNSEVKHLSQFRHKNIVPIIGYSKDGPALCIICEYIDGGCLEQKLAEKVLSERQRINIMLGTAEGLQYLHGYELVEKGSFSDSNNSSRQNVSKTNFVHRDVKSANILLTKDLVPKLCDFGLAKQYENNTAVMSVLMGTQAYMAPEGNSGTVTQKMDIYSYGIVLLEVLTGLECIVQVNNNLINITHYIEDAVNLGQTINDLLDSSAGVWTKAEDMYNLAQRCLTRNRHDRPSINEVCEILHSINVN